VKHQRDSGRETDEDSKDAICKVILTINLHNNIEQKILLQKI
jgi:hypothetical protein